MKISMLIKSVYPACYRLRVHVYFQWNCNLSLKYGFSNVRYNFVSTGDKFMVQDFHEAVLQCGPAQLSVLESVIDKYIEATKSQSM